MRLIDADELIEKLRDFKEWEDDTGKTIHTVVINYSCNTST